MVSKNKNSFSGSIIKVEQTVMPKSWIELIRYFEEFDEEELSRMMKFMAELKSSARNAYRKDGIKRGNALIDAINLYQSEKAGTNLVAHKHEKSDEIRAAIRKIACPLIERGRLYHNEIADKVIESIGSQRGRDFVLGVIRGLCRDKGREDLIRGLSKEK